MKTERTVKNAAASILYYIVSIIGGILLRKAVIVFLGIEYQGIDGLFTNVLTMLSIAELGIGSAVICNLYRPVKEEDTETVKSLMGFYRKAYFWIAAIILIVGLAISPVLPYLVRDYSLTYPLFSIYIWFLLDSVASYFLSYRRSILIADQKSYVISIVEILYVVLVKALQILVLWKTGNYILFLVAMVVARLIENVAIYLITENRYPYLAEKNVEPVGKELLSSIRLKVQGAICHKIGYFVVLGTDNILISKYLGLFWSGVYSNYFVIINAIQNICTKTVSASVASIGHLLAEENKEKNKEIFDELQYINVFLTTCAVTGVYCVCTDTVSYIFGAKYTVDRMCMFVLALNLGVGCMRTVYASFKDAAGIFYEDRLVPLLESAVNIIASIILLKKFGLSGVFMGTILSSLFLYGYTFPVLIYHGVIGGDYKNYVIDNLWQFGIIIISMLLSEKICALVAFHGFATLIMKALLSLAGALLVFFVGYGVWRPEKKEVITRARKLVRRER